MQGLDSNGSLGRLRRAGQRINVLRPRFPLSFVYATRANIPDYIVKKSGSSQITYRVIADHLGTPRLLVNVASGAVAHRLDLDEWGNVTSENGDTTLHPFGFAGGVWDRETALVRFGARDYDAETGRWTARDPIGLAAGDTNLYAYAGNNPLNLRDPNGLWIVQAAGAAVGAGFNMYDTWKAGGSAGDIAIAGAVGAVTGALSTLGAGWGNVALGALTSMTNKVAMNAISSGAGCSGGGSLADGVLLAGAFGAVGNGLANSIANRAQVRVLSGLPGRSHFFSAGKDLSRAAGLADVVSRSETMAVYNSIAFTFNESWTAVGTLFGNGAAGLGQEF